MRDAVRLDRGPTSQCIVSPRALGESLLDPAGPVCPGRCCCGGTPGISLKMLFLGTLVILSGCPTFRGRRPQVVGYEYCRRIRRWQSNCSQAQLVCKLVLETEEEIRKDPPSKLTREKSGMNADPS